MFVNICWFYLFLNFKHLILILNHRFVHEDKEGHHIMHTKKKIVVCVKSMHCLINFVFFWIYLCDNVIFWEKNINGQDDVLNHTWYFKEIIYVHLPYNDISFCLFLDLMKIIIFNETSLLKKQTCSMKCLI